jgi:hypothetical protein
MGPMTGTLSGGALPSGILDEDPTIGETASSSSPTSAVAAVADRPVRVKEGLKAFER